MPSVRCAAAVLAAALLLVACDTAVTPAPATPVLPAATATLVATAAPSPPSTATTVAPPATATPAGDGQIDTKALYHMSRDPVYRSPGGAVPAGTTVTLRLRAAPGDLTGADVRTFDSRTNADQTLPMRLEQQTAAGDLWGADVTTPRTPGLFTYRFVAHDGAKTVVYQDDAAHDGGTGEARALPGMNDYTINAYDPQWTIPAWMQDAVIYQIFPDRFDNGDPGNDRPAGQVVYDSVTTQSAWGAKPQGSYDFFGGDLQGVIDKLDYLQSLGATVIYFNPIFVAASNHGYDTQDYLHIAPWFGDQATFDRLIAETQKRGMHVILDGVFNHVSSDSPWFDRYSHFPTLGAYESKDSPYFSWFRFSGWPTSYFDFSNNASLPQLQEIDPVRDLIYRTPDSVAQHWLAAGAAGWRLDVGQAKTDRWWRDFRTVLRGTYPDAVIIGEFWQNASPWLSGDEWDGVMNYRFHDAAIGFFAPNGGLSTTRFDTALASIREDYPPNASASSMNLIDSHDTARALTEMGGDKSRLRLLALLQFTSAGAPTVYYGDEAGLAGGKDPDDRRTYPWGNEDTSLIAYYQTLAAARHRLSTLRTGDTVTLLAQDRPRVYAYARHDAAGTAIVAFNLDSAPQPLSLDVHALLADGAALHDLLSNGTTATVQAGHLQFTVPPGGAVLLLP